MATRADITPELCRQLLRYDPETGKLWWKVRPRDMFTTQRAWSTWNSRYAGTLALDSPDATGYRYGAILNRPCKAHRVAFAIATGAWPQDQIDHINGDRADNRITNLRNVSSRDNHRNMARVAHNRSGVNGVIWDRCRGKWMAYITIDRRFRNLGRFDTIEEAADARAAADIEFGFSSRHGRASG